MSTATTDLLRDEIARHGGDRVLDLPAGAGRLSRALDEVGCDVTSADLFPECLEWPGHESVPADMNEPLPFPDGAFDHVVCQEGVEHLENLPRFIRECSRVLREGGYVWITTPNFMDLSSRLSYLLTGMKSFHSGFPNEETTIWGGDGERFYHGHAFTLPFFQIRYLLRLAQFDEIALRGLKRSTASTVLYPFVRPLTGVLVRWSDRKRRRKRQKAERKPIASPELQRELSGFAASSELLCHRKVFVRARKVSESFRLPTPQEN